MAKSVIALITTSLGWGGTEGHVTDLAIGFVRRGIQPVVIVDHPPLDRIEILKEAGVRIEVLSNTGVFSPELYKSSLKELLQDIKASILHVNAWERRELIHEAAKDAGIAVIETLHLTFDYNFRYKYMITRHPILLWRQINAYRKTNPSIINISEKSDINFRKQYPFIKNTRRIYCGVYVPRFSNDVNRSGISPTVLWIGSLIERKRPLYALEVWKRIMPEYPGAKLVLVGDGSEFNKVKETIKEFNMDNVTMCGNVKDLHPILLSGDIMLHTSTAEGIPKNIIYALAFGVPIVSTNVGAISEAVIDGKNGFLSDVNDIDRMEFCLRQLLGNPVLRNEMGIVGRQMGEDLFNFDGMIDNVLKSYRELCGMDIIWEPSSRDFPKEFILS